MKLKHYIKQSPRGAGVELAKTLGVDPSFISQMASGAAAIHPRTAVKIEKATKKQVLREDMFEDWEEIWPELKSRQKRRHKQVCAA